MAFPSRRHKKAKEMFDMGNFCKATIPQRWWTDMRYIACEDMVAFFADTYIKNSRLALLGAMFGNEPHARGTRYLFWDE